MSHPMPEAPTPPPPAEAEAPITCDHPARIRLQHLFRHTLQRGLVNPLLHIVLRHRLEQPK